MSEWMRWIALCLLPIPEDVSAFFIIMWTAALVAGVLLGLKFVRRQRRVPRKQRSMWPIYVAIALFPLNLLAMHDFSAARIATTKDQLTSVILPLWACSNAAEFYPGGRRVNGAAFHDFSRVAREPDCTYSTRASIILYGIVSTHFYVIFGIVLGCLLHLVSRQPIVMRPLTAISRFFG